MEAQEKSVELVELGRRINEANLESARRANYAGRAEARFFSSPRSKASAGWRLATGISLVAAVAVAFLLLSKGEPLTAKTAAGDVVPSGSWIEAPAREAVVVHFSEGSRVEAEQGSRLQLSELDDNGGKLILEGGRLRAHIAPRSAARWSFAAGPFTVSVTGTAFELSWNDEEHALRLQMLDGSVVVHGSCKGQRSQEGRKLSAGHRLEIHCTSDERAPAASAPVPSPEKETAAAKGRKSHAAPLQSAPAQAPAPKAPARANASDASAADWHELYVQGEYKGAMQLARLRGLSTLRSELDAERLWDLAELVRLSGAGAEARVTLEQLRRRFPGHSRAPVAAFTLGRIALEQSGNPNAAAGWFRTYLREAPGGSLAEDAKGRLIESLVKAGKMPQARAAATSYLESHPEGRYARLAKSLKK